jgi:ComF family protein
MPRRKVGISDILSQRIANVLTRAYTHPVLMKPWWKKCLDTLLPRHCILCGHASGVSNLCPPCADELPRISLRCGKCSLPLPDTDEAECDDCRRRPVPWDSAIAALEYAFPSDQLVRRFKFSRNLACGRLLAEELTRSIAGRCLQWPDAIVPVPLHRLRYFTRSFNQSELLARYAGRHLRIPVYSGILRRCRRTRAHSGLDAISRRINIKGAFRCKLAPWQRDCLRHIALVDDVLTTGATLSECTRALRSEGIDQVSVWVAARAPQPRSQAGE